MYSYVILQTIFLLYRSGSKDLLKGIYCMSYTRPSKIQQMAIPLILADP